MKPQPIIVLFKDCQFHRGSTAVHLINERQYSGRNNKIDSAIKKNLVEQLAYLKIQNCILKNLLATKGISPTDLNIFQAI